jgi:hypothetical protein
MNLRFLSVAMLTLALASSLVLVGCKKEPAAEDTTTTNVEETAPATEAAPAEGAAAPAAPGAAAEAGAAATEAGAAAEHADAAASHADAAKEAAH